VSAWPITELASAARTLRRVSFGAADATFDRRPGSIPCLTTAAVKSEPKWDTARYIPARLVNDEQLLRPGDILVSTSNSAEIVGRSCIVSSVPETATFGAFVTVVRPDANVFDARFLALWMRSHAYLKAIARLKTRTTNISNIRTSDLGRLMVPLPPLDEQRRITARLREQLAQVDRIREGVNQQVRGLKALVASTIRTAIGVEFETVRAIELGSIAEVQLGKMMSPAARRGERALPYLRNANVQWDRFDLSDVGLMDFTVAEEAKFVLRPDDVLVCEGGEPGRAAVWAGQIVRCGYQKALHRIRPLPARLDPQFLVYRLWLGALDGEFADSQAATTIAHLPAVRLKDLKLALPSFGEQRRIAARLRERLAEIDQAKAALEAQRKAIDALPAALLREVFGPAKLLDR